MWKKLLNRISLTTNGTNPVEKTILLDTTFTAGGYTGNSNITGDPTDYSRYYKGWVYANLNAIASSVSKMEIKLYKVRVIAGVPEMIEIESHPVLDSLDRLNAFTSYTDGLYITQTYKDMAGDCFWYIDDSKDNIYVLEPNKVKVLFDYVGGGGVKITGYEYTTLVNGKPEKETYAPDQVVPFKNPNPLNPVRGMGSIAVALDTIDTDIYAEDFNKRFFLNNATPDTVLTTDQRITQENMRRLESDLKRRFGGTKNAHKTMILQGGLNIQPLNSTQRDMEFLEQSKWVRDKMMAIFGNTKMSLGLVEDVNRASADASLYGWLKEVIKPKMQSFVDALNEFYLPNMTGEPLIFGFEDPYPEDSAEDITMAKEGYNKWLTRNEARDLFELEPVEGGDEFTQAVNPLDPNNPDPQTPAKPTDGKEPTDDNLPKAIRNVNYEKRFRQLGIQTIVEKQKELLVATKQIAAEAVKEAQGMIEHEHIAPKKDIRWSEFFTNDDVLSYHHAKINKVESVETRFKIKLTEYLGRLEEKVMNSVSQIEVKGLAKAALDPLVNIDDEVSFGINLFTPLMEEATMIGGMAAQALLNEKLNYKPSAEIRAAVKASVKKFTKSMTETDMNALTDKIVQLTADGVAIPEIRNEVKAFFEGATRDQVEMITRTEVLRTANAASIDAYKQSDVVVGKQWVTAGDACEFCLELEKEYADVPLDSTFADEGDIIETSEGKTFEISYGSLDQPPLHPNCRCDVLPVLADEFNKTLSKALKPKKVKPTIDKKALEIEQLKADLEKEKAYAKELEELVSE